MVMGHEAQPPGQLLEAGSWSASRSADESGGRCRSSGGNWSLLLVLRKLRCRGCRTLWWCWSGCRPRSVLRNTLLRSITSPAKSGRRAASCGAWRKIVRWPRRSRSQRVMIGRGMAPFRPPGGKKCKVKHSGLRAVTTVRGGPRAGCLDKGSSACNPFGRGTMGLVMPYAVE